jgi:hypothetical protein
MELYEIQCAEKHYFAENIVSIVNKLTKFHENEKSDHKLRFCALIWQGMTS